MLLKRQLRLAVRKNRERRHFRRCAEVARRARPEGLGALWNERSIYARRHVLERSDCARYRMWLRMAPWLIIVVCLQLAKSGDVAKLAGGESSSAIRWMKTSTSKLQRRYKSRRPSNFIFAIQLDAVNYFIINSLKTGTSNQNNPSRYWSRVVTASFAPSEIWNVSYWTRKTNVRHLVLQK